MAHLLGLLIDAVLRLALLGVIVLWLLQVIGLFAVTPIGIESWLVTLGLFTTMLLGVAALDWWLAWRKGREK